MGRSFSPGIAHAMGADLKAAGERVRIAMARKQRIAYIGAGMRDNIGDLAVFEALNENIENYGFAAIPVPYDSREARLARVGLSGRPYFSSVVIGGGTLINGYWLERVRSWARLGQTMWTFGTGVGSSGYSMPNKVAMSSDWVRLLEHFQSVGVRGPRSADFLQNRSVKNVSVIGDAAFSLARDFGSQESQTRDAFFVNVASSATAPRDAVRRQIGQLRLAAMAAEKSGLKPVGLVLSPMDAEPTLDVLRNLSSQIDLRRPSGVGETLDILASCRLGFTVRLHGAVLGSCVGTPSLLVSYRDKCLDYLESIRGSRWAISSEASDGEVATLANELIVNAETEGRRQLQEATNYKYIQAEYVVNQMSGLANVTRSQGGR